MNLLPREFASQHFVLISQERITNDYMHFRNTSEYLPCSWTCAVGWQERASTKMIVKDLELGRLRMGLVSGEGRLCHRCLGTHLQGKDVE